MVVKEVLQKSPEGEEQTGQPSDVDKDQLRATSETDPHGQTGFAPTCWVVGFY